MTKSEQALSIYTEEVAKNTPDLRAVCVERFIAELGMTKTGATTYFYNSKKKSSGGVVKSYYKNRADVDTSTDKPDNRVLYSIVTEESGTVDSTDSGYHLKDLQRRAAGRVIVKGMPDIGVEMSTLKAIN